jgi:hypothetical protein
MTTPTKPITIKDPGAPATEAQVKYLTFLADTRPAEAEAVQRARFAMKHNMLTKGIASNLIDVLKKMPKAKPVYLTVPTGWDAPIAPAPAPAPIPEPEPIPVDVTPDYGYYTVVSKDTGKEFLYYWDKAKKNGYMIPKLRRLVLKKTWDGKTIGRWLYVGGTYAAKKVLAGLNPMTAAQAGALGKQYGCCVRCGKTLTDPVSVAQGIGPVCITYGGWA